MSDDAPAPAAEAVTETPNAPAAPAPDAAKAARQAERRAKREAERLAAEGPARENFVATADIQLGEDVARRGSVLALTAAHAAELKAFLRPATALDISLGGDPRRFG